MKHKQLLYFLLLSNAAALFVITQALYSSGLFENDGTQMNAGIKMRLIVLIPFVLSFFYLVAQILKSPGSKAPTILDQEDSSSTNEDWD